MEDPSHIVQSISPSHVERSKPDYFDCDFIHQTLSVCSTIDLSLDSLKNDLTKTLKLRTKVIPDEKIRLSSRDFSSDLQSPEKYQNQVFWKRYSGQKMDSKNQRLALSFEASKNSNPTNYLRDDIFFPKPHPVMCIISFCKEQHVLIQRKS